MTVSKLSPVLNNPWGNLLMLVHNDTFFSTTSSTTVLSNFPLFYFQTAVDATFRFFNHIFGSRAVFSTLVWLCSWASTEIFPGGNVDLWLSLSGCRQCNANGCSQNALPFQSCKRNTPCYGDSHKNVLCWHCSNSQVYYDNLHNRLSADFQFRKSRHFSKKHWHGL